MNIKNPLIGAVVAGTLTSLAANAAMVMDTSDLVSIVGTGSNLSTLVIDFNDGTTTQSFAWGYRWDGTASGEDLLTAIVDADDSLIVDSTSFITNLSYFDGTQTHQGVSDFTGGSNLSWGYYITGGFGGDDDLTNGMVDTPTAIPGGGSVLPGSWVRSLTGNSLTSFGESGRILEDGSWDAWSFGAFNPGSFEHETPPGGEFPEAAVIVPEPSAALLSFLSLGLLARRRRA